ncbi:MAG: hypothetical protein GYA23_04760 [Methanomicrobiales archaeon]|nr:hypothetical protein [Methanomicrobiales archaeon]
MPGTLMLFMDLRMIIPALLCIACAIMAGCTTDSATPVTVTTAPVTPAGVAPTPMNAMGCTDAADCVPADCCHPRSCVNKAAQKSCTGIACTESCEGPLDCGAGSCGCVQGTCSVVAARAAEPVTTAAPSVRIRATPQRYSPMMSSTPGIELSVITQGIDTSTAEYDWTASYGQFLSWNPPDYTINQKGSAVTNHGEKLYWSFIDRPSSTVSPVIITVVMREAAGKELGRSVATLEWDGTNAVAVKEIT